MTLRSAFVLTVTRLMEGDEKIILLLGDISVFAFKDAAERWPARVLNMGCTEGASVSFAAGLAIAGFYPIFHTISPFIARRAYEQILIDFGFQGLAGLFVGVGGTLDYERLGKTHQCAEEMSLMLGVPGMIGFWPYTDAVVASRIEDATTNRRLAYMRIEETLRVQA